MSKNGIIGQIVCGLPGMETKYLRVIADVTSSLNGTSAEALRKQLLQILRNPSKVTKGYSVLAQNETFELDLSTETVDFGNFFQTGDTLYVDPDFTSRIVAVATAGHLTSFALESFSLVKAGNDAEICSELSVDHVLSATEACHVIAHTIKQQPNGGEGHLITSNFWNIFYVQGFGGGVFAVYVRWYADGRRWLVRCYRLDDYRWDAGNRVFSRN